MIVDLAVVADAANVSVEGKFNVVGMFDTIAALQFPALHPSMSFAFRLLTESEDSGRQVRLEVALIDADARPMWSATAQVVVPAIPAGEFKHIPQVINLQGVLFQRPGRYRFCVRLEGEDRSCDAVFQVIQIQPPQG